VGRNDTDSTNRHFGKFLMYFHVYSHTLYRQILCKFRISAHNLRIETGRYEKTKDNSGNYSKLEKENRICKFCNLRMVEDESHFLLKCPLYIVRDSSAVRRLLWTCCSRGTSQRALHTENSWFVSPTLGRHIFTFRGLQILFSIRNPYINRFTNHFSIHS
jgi:hypothetical protein